jgi:hypothetical protein
MNVDEDELAKVLHQSCGRSDLTWKECDFWYRHTTDSRNVGYYLRFPAEVTS